MKRNTNFSQSNITDNRQDRNKRVNLCDIDEDTISVYEKIIVQVDNHIAAEPQTTTTAQHSLKKNRQHVSKAAPDQAKALNGNSATNKRVVREESEPVDSLKKPMLAWGNHLSKRVFTSDYTGPTEDSINRLVSRFTIN